MLCPSVNDTEEIGELQAVNLTAAAPPRWRLAGLRASTKYKLYLRACTARGCGKAVTEETATLGAGGEWGAGGGASGSVRAGGARPPSVWLPVCPAAGHS